MISLASELTPRTTKTTLTSYIRLGRDATIAITANACLLLIPPSLRCVVSANRERHCERIMNWIRHVATSDVPCFLERLLPTRLHLSVTSGLNDGAIVTHDQAGWSMGVVEVERGRRAGC